MTPPTADRSDAGSFHDHFHDHFSGHAADYAAFRPTYPAALLDHLVSLAPSRELAWDCGTGNGQAAVALAERFARVVATDASREQIANAAPHPRVDYRVGTEADSGLAPRSADLVTVAQALHWFDLPRFHREVARVLKPDGLVAVWCYGRVQLPPPLRAIVDRFYSQRVGRFWPPERRLVEDGYRDLDFPYAELPAPPFAMNAPMTREEFLGYVGTWSAVARARAEARQESAGDPIAELAAELAPLWPDASQRRDVSWPISLRLGRLPPRPESSLARPSPAR